MEVRIIRVEHGGEFFNDIAMASLDKSIRKELGYPISSEPNQKWWIALNGNHVLGFCSLVEKKNESYMCHDYVYNYFRGKGIYDKLFKERFEYAVSLKKKIKSVATNKSLGAFLRYGFQVTKKLTNYTNVQFN